MNISKATLEDIPLLEKLINSAYRGEESKKGWTTDADLLEGKRINIGELREIITQPNTVILKCSNDDNDLIGCVYLKKNDNKMYLGMLTVSPVLQASGIGKKILNAAEEYAAQQKCNLIQMRVISVRHELIAWYQKHGYSKTGETIPYVPGPGLSTPKQPLEFIVMKKIID